MSFARVIPLLRTPSGIDGFDYRIPSELSIKAGDLVIVPFRKNTIVGIVAETLKHSAFAHQAVPIKEKYADLHLPQPFLDLVRWTAERTFSSQPTILKSWLRQLPKRPTSTGIVEAKQTQKGAEARWTIHPTQALLEKAKEAGLHSRVLIVTPWITRAKQLQEKIANSLLLHSELSDGQAFQSWTNFLNKDTGTLITTKIGAWLATCTDLVILDGPEYDDHKQDDSAPRYDARKILLWCAQQGVTRVESFGLTPPLHVQANSPEIKTVPEMFVYHPQGRSSIPCIQAQTLEQVIEHQGPRVIIHPIQGTLARITCRDCHWQPTCERCGSCLAAEEQSAICRRCHQRSPLPLECPHCQGVDLSKSLPGIERLEREWKKHYPDISIEWRGSNMEQLNQPLAFNALVLVTDVGLLGGGEDIRRRERQCYIMRRLADRVDEVQGRLLLQCREELADTIPKWFTESGMIEFSNQERETRRIFNYPPAKRLIKIVIKGDEQAAEAWQKRAKGALANHRLANNEWRGPFAVEYQPKNRQKRLILHLLFPSDTPEALLLDCLRPLINQQVIADLDPIAFLR